MHRRFRTRSNRLSASLIPRPRARVRVRVRVGVRVRVRARARVRVRIRVRALPTSPSHQLNQGHGCIVGIVDVECTWHADLFNEV